MPLQDLYQEPGRINVLDFVMAQQSGFCQEISSGVWKFLGPMKQDEVTTALRNDILIIQFAESLYNRHEQDPAKYEYTDQKPCEIYLYIIWRKL